MSKMNWKKVIGWGVAALVVIGVVGTNMYNQQNTDNSKKNVYAVLPLTGPLSVWGKQAKETIDYYLKTHVHDKLNLIYIDSESNPFDLSGKRVILYAEKPDKMIVFNECTVIGDPSNGKILVEITAQMACSTGIVNCEFHVIKNNSVILKVTDLKIISNECLFNEQQIVSSNEYTALLEALRRSDEALETAQELIDSYDSRLPVSQKGTWTPRLVKHFEETTLPDYSFHLSEAFYYRIGKICYIFVNLTVDVTSCQGETICIGGLPYVSASDVLIQHVIPGLNCGFVPSPSGEGRYRMQSNPSRRGR